jgi:hypothetical protein
MTLVVVLCVPLAVAVIVLACRVVRLRAALTESAHRLASWIVVASGRTEDFAALSAEADTLRAQVAAADRGARFVVPTAQSVAAGGAR